MSKNDGLKLLTSAVGLILALPPFPLGPIAAVALLPLFLFLKKNTFRQSLWGGYFLGLIWATGTIYWIGWATVPGVIGTVLFVSLYLVIFCGVLNRLFSLWGDRAIWAAPFLWTGMEIITGEGVLGFPWNSLAHSMIQFPQTIQFASITGMYGVTFWLVLLNALFFYLFQNALDMKRSFRSLGWVVLLILLPVIHGHSVLIYPPSETPCIFR